MPGYKLIESLSNNFWIDPVKAEKWLRTSMRFKYDQISPRKMISPSAVTKLLKTRKGNIKEVPADRINRTVTGVSLVKESAKGAVYVPGGSTNAMAEKLHNLS